MPLQNTVSPWWDFDVKKNSIAGLIVSRILLFACMAILGFQRFSLVILNLQFFTMMLDCNFQFDDFMKYIKHTFKTI